MGNKTGISWTDATWNCVRGCSRTCAAGTNQSGCGDGTGGGCYAEAQAGRIVRMGRGKPTKYDGLVRETANGWRWTGAVRLVAEHLADPLRWRRPRRIFVNSMSDLFHEELINEQIAAVFGVMAVAWRHTHQVLTKRARRAREWFAWSAEHGGLDVCLREALCHLPDFEPQIHAARLKPWPLPNVWIGTSVENQAAADERIPELLATPAAVRFLSCEPLLGPVVLDDGRMLGSGNWLRALRRGDIGIGGDEIAIDRPRIDWTIAGCESGPGARPCSVAWLRSLRDQCAAAGVPFWLKQAPEMPRSPTVPPGASRGPLFTLDAADLIAISAGPGSKRKAGGVIGLPYLDGVQHAAFPKETR